MGSGYSMPRSVTYNRMENSSNTPIFLSINQKRIWESAMNMLEYLSDVSKPIIYSAGKKETVLKLEILFVQIRTIYSKEPPDFNDYCPPPLYDETTGETEYQDITESPEHRENYIKYILECVEYLNNFCSLVVT